MRMFTVRKSRFTCVVALSALAAAPVASGQDAGQLLFVKGDVQIVAADGARRPARKGEMIREGERVVTGPGAMGQVKMTDGGFVGVRPDSGVRFEPRAASGPRSMALTAGKVRVLNVDGGRGVSPMVVKTPHGQLQMREADALAGILPVAPGDDGTVRTVLKLNRGTGTAVDQAGTPLEMAGGDAVSVRPGAATPQRVSALTVPLLGNAIPPGDSGSSLGARSSARSPVVEPVRLARLPTPIEPVAAGPRGGVLAGLTLSDGISPVAKATGAGAPAPTRVIDPNVLTAVTTGRLPGIEFTRSSTSSLDDAVRDIVSASTGSRTTLSSRTTTTVVGSRLVAPTATGNLTGTVTGTRITNPTISTPIKTGTVIFRR